MMYLLNFVFCIYAINYDNKKNTRFLNNYGADILFVACMSIDVDNIWFNIKAGTLLVF